MAFGNPYGDLWSVDEVVEAVGLLEIQEIQTISLADTVGVARQKRSKKLFPR
jgi:hydroxymethylglutaryl-CoA lyase